MSSGILEGLRAEDGAAGDSSEDMRVHFLASMVSGVFCVTAFCPFDVVSSRLYMQRSRQYAGLFSTLAGIVKQEGLLALWKGWGALYLRTGPSSVLTLMAWEQMRLLLD